MALSMETLQTEYKEQAFFTSNRACIEYLLLRNLSPLEEYALFIINGEAWFITPEEMEDSPVKTILYTGYSNLRYQNKIENIIEKLNEVTFPKLVETAFERQEYLEYFQKRDIQTLNVNEKMMEYALIKNKDQIEAIRFCVEMNEKAFEVLGKTNALNQSELSLFQYVKESNMRCTSYQNEMIYDFLAGSRTGEVSSFPTNYRLEKGDVLIADLLPRHNGVYADMTRTFFVGRPRDKQIYIYEILCETLLKTEALLRPGIEAKEVYSSVYEQFRKYKLESYFPHHAGHGLGMGYYEAPYFLKEENRILEENMVVAIEPGLYFEKEFGMRIENNYVITKDGAERLDKLPLTLEKYVMNY